MECRFTPTQRSQSNGKAESSQTWPCFNHPRIRPTWSSVSWMNGCTTTTSLPHKDLRMLFSREFIRSQRNWNCPFLQGQLHHRKTPLKAVIALNLQDAELPLPCSPSSRKPVTEPAATSNGQAEASCLTLLTMKPTLTANAGWKDKRTRQEDLPGHKGNTIQNERT